MLRKLIIASLALVVLLNMAGPQFRPALSLDEEPPPPTIIDVYPPEGAELLPSDTLTITFDQPMNHASVEQALTFSPALHGQYIWSDAQTLNFKPQGGWPRAKSFTAQLNTKALADNGLPLEAPYQFDLRTLSPLRVAEVSPQTDAKGIPLDAKIVASFNRPVVALGAADEPNLLRIDPPVTGKGSWVNTSLYVFTPDKPLQRNTQYTVRVGGGLQATDGSLLEHAYSWSFSTVPPQVEAMSLKSKDERYTWVDAKAVALDQPIQIKFNQPMDQKSTEAAFSLKAKDHVIDGTFKWSARDTELVFTPTRLMRLDSDYTATLKKTARSADLGALGEEITLNFHTQALPAISRTSPKNGEENFNPSFLGFSIYFTVPMKFGDYETNPSKYVQISPDVKIDRAWTFESTTLNALEFRLDKATLQPQTHYTITLKAGLTDLYGNAIKEDYTFSFTTAANLSRDASDNRFEPVINGDLMITSADKADTTVDVRMFGEQHVNVELYRLPPTELSSRTLTNHQTWGLNGYWHGGYSSHAHCSAPPAVKPANLMRSWSIEHKRGDPEPKVTVPLASKQGGRLPPGLYWIVMGDPMDCTEDYDALPAEQTFVKSPEAQFGIAVVTANLTIKRGTENVFVWMNGLKDSAPIANAEVKVYDGEKLISTGKTDQNGAAQIPVRVLEHKFIFITAETADHFAAWYNTYSDYGRRFEGDNGYFNETYYRTPPDTQGYIYTDRAIYRPGDTIHFRGVIRNKRDMDFPVPDNRTAYIRIGHGVLDGSYLLASSTEVPLLDKKTELTEFGTFSGEYQIPKDAKPDTLYILASPDHRTLNSEYYYNDISFDGILEVKIADYRAADFEVKVTPDNQTIFQGDPIQATLEGHYYFGGAVSDRPVSWNISWQRAAGFRYTGAGSYSFGTSYWSYGSEIDDEDPYYYDYNSSDTNLDHGRTKTDSQGKVTVNSSETNPFSSSSNDRDNSPVLLMLEGSMEDESGTSVSGRASVLAYPTNLYIGMNAPTRIARPGQKIAIDLITVNANSSLRPNQTLSVVVQRYYWGSELNSTVVFNSQGSVTTDAQGKAQYQFAPDKPGSYYLIFKGADEQGRSSTSTIFIWVTDNKEAWVNLDATKLISPVIEKSSYHAGEVANILLPNPYPDAGLALITVERANVLSYAVVPTDGALIRYQLPITDDFAPFAYIKAVFIAKPDKAHPYPRFRVSGRRRILVEPVKRRLKVDVTLPQENLKPGETVNVKVRVTDSEGNPAKAEVGLALVDKAALALAPANSIALEKTFYVQTRYGNYGWYNDLDVITDLSLDGLLEAFDPNTTGPDGHGGGGSPGPTPFLLRERFETTPLWQPHVVTDAEGYASVAVKLPDNLTTWVLDARALTVDLKVGQATAEIVSSLPLIARPVAPRFFVVGDKVELAAVINNNTNKLRNVKVTLKAEGVALSGSAEQTIEIAANGRSRVVWPVTVKDMTGVDMTVIAQSDDGLSDAAKPALRTGPNDTIPVYRYTVRDASYSTSGVLRQTGARTEAITLPPRLKATQGDLVVRVDPSLSATLPDSFTFLRQFPYFCIEQTVSRFLPNLATYQALKALNMSDSALEADLKKQISAAMTKLANEQKPDGSWGWYPSMATDPLTSAYAALGLIQARSAGFTIDATMTNRAIAYVKTLVEQPLGSDGTQLDRQAFYFYVLAQADMGDATSYAALFKARNQLSVSGKAFLTMAYTRHLPGDAAIKALSNDLLSAATLSATGAHWTAPDRSWHNWDTDIRVTSLALSALSKVAPESDVLPNAVRWLMAARHIDHWATTQETVWSIIALTDWMLRTGELRSSYHYNVLFNRENIMDATVLPDNVRDTRTLRVAVGNLLAANRLTIARGEGTGSLYYTARFDLQVLASHAQAVSQGIIVKREYFVGADNKTPATSAKIGDLVTVRLTITAPEDISYFMLEDTFPAGTEAVDTSLLTTTSDANDSDAGRFSRYDAYWYWGWSAFKQVELHDAHLNLYADKLPRGTYVYTYQVHANIAGVYQTIPAFATTFYDANVYGRSEGTLFTVEEWAR